MQIEEYVMSKFNFGSNNLTIYCSYESEDIIKYGSQLTSDEVTSQNARINFDDQNVHVSTLNDNEKFIKSRNLEEDSSEDDSQNFSVLSLFLIVGITLIAVSMIIILAVSSVYISHIIQNKVEQRKKMTEGGFDQRTQIITLADACTAFDQNNCAI